AVAARDRSQPCAAPPGRAPARAAAGRRARAGGDGGSGRTAGGRAGRRGAAPRDCIAPRRLPRGGRAVRPAGAVVSGGGRRGRLRDRDGAFTAASRTRAAGRHSTEERTMDRDDTTLERDLAQALRRLNAATPVPPPDRAREAALMAAFDA